MPKLVEHPDIHGEMCRVYTNKEAAKLIGRHVVCDMVDCPQHICVDHGRDESVPHIYDDAQCYHLCCWPGRTGLCVPVEALGLHRGGDV